MTKTCEPTLLSHVDAALALPAGGTLRDHYRLIELTCWDAEENEDVADCRFFQPVDEPAPWLIHRDGYTYRQGQCSGPAMRWVAYEREGIYC